MRLVRLAALFGSLVLLTATLVLVIERRAEVRDDQVARAQGVADAALVSVDAVLGGVDRDVAAAVDGLSADPDDAEVADAASRLAATTADASACVVSGSSSACTADDLLGLERAGDLLALADSVSGNVVTAVDESIEAVLVLRRDLSLAATDGSDPAIAIVAVPAADLLSSTADAVAERRDAQTTIRLDDASVEDERGEPEVADGVLVVRDRIGEPFAAGSIVVTTGVDAEIGLLGNSPNFFLVLIGFGSVLLVLAAITFFADRRHLEERAATDALTGLTNRREFERVAGEAVELADRFGTGLTIMMVDLNGFKQINDTLGHQYGDLVLKGVSDRLVAAVRDSDLVARWGGDEFVILLPGLDDATAIRNSAERITSTLSSSAVVGDTVMRASIGAAAFPRHGGSLDTLLRTADAAMYAAKTSGVDHRVADAELARRANGAPVEDAVVAAADRLVVTSDYVGPNRRAHGGDVVEAPSTAADSSVTPIRGTRSAGERGRPDATPPASDDERCRRIDPPIRRHERHRLTAPRSAGDDRAATATPVTVGGSARPAAVGGRTLPRWPPT